MICTEFYGYLLNVKSEEYSFLVSFHILNFRWEDFAALCTLTLCNNIGLYIPIVVFAGPYKSSIRLESLCDHVVYKAMLIPNPSIFEVFLVCAL